MKSERSDDSKHPSIGFWCLLTSEKRINQKQLSPRFFDTLSLPEKKTLYHLFFSQGKSIFFFLVLGSMQRI